MADDLLVDSFGRRISKLRISVTDRCNFRCVYCLPSDRSTQWIDREGILTFEQIEKIVRVLARLGVDHLRLTGGEPLLRKDLPDLVRRLRDVEGIKGLALTTNGYDLGRHARALREAGIQTVNVSLDSLQSGRFALMTGADMMQRVLSSIVAAMESGLRVKVNCVLIRGINDGEVEAVARLAERNPYEVRFIEFMPFDGSGLWNRSRVVPSQEVVRRLSDLVPLSPSKGPVYGPARTFTPSGWAGTLGVIPSLTEPFCSSCNRLRLTAAGRLVSCLYARDEQNDLRDMVLRGASDSDLEESARNVVRLKPVGCVKWVRPAGAEAEFFPPPTTLRHLPSMHELGG